MAAGDRPEVVVSGLSHRFQTRSVDRPALQDIDLTVPGGGLTALLGPSGCGKSTLLRLVCGLDQPTRGTITIGGRSPGQARSRGAIGFVPQSPALLPWLSVRKNVSLLDQLGGWDQPRLGAGDLTDWLDRVGLSDAAELLPHQLSGGMQQRVALARAFAIEPSLLLLDEPFGALDELTRHEMHVLLNDLRRRQGPTVLFVTHSIDEAVKLADRVVVMSSGPGRIVARFDTAIDGRDRFGVEDSPTFRAYTADIRRALAGGQSSP